MIISFIIAALIVGVVAGVALGYESRFLRDQPAGWRPWLVFGFAVAVGAVGSYFVNYINETNPPSTAVKGLAVLAGALAFSISMYLTRRDR
jgi:uncharacterized membrane-anchored protein